MTFTLIPRTHKGLTTPWPVRTHLPLHTPVRTLMFEVTRFYCPTPELVT